MRIHITGNAGAGKTTLAHQIGAALNLPVYSVDSVIWQPGWSQPPKEEREAAILAMAQKPHWVIEGVAASLRAHADIVLVLHVPAFICAVRALRRAFRYGRSIRPGFPEGCPEWKVTPLVIRIIFSFKRRAGAELFAEAARDEDKFRILSWPTNSDKVIANLRRARVEHTGLVPGTSAHRASGSSPPETGT